MNNKSAIEELLSVMKQLRDEKKGCAWSKEQTLHSLIRHTIEESYEVADAIERQEYQALKGELAD